MPPLNPFSRLPVIILLLGVAALVAWLVNRTPPASPPDSTRLPEAKVENPSQQAGVEPPRFVTRRVSVSYSPSKNRDGTPPQIEVLSDEFSADVPAVFLDFDRWARRYAVASPAERASLLAEGRALASKRAALLGQLIADDPEAAIFLTPPPAVRATLPPEIAASLGNVIAAKGFYGVKAICNHGPDVPHGEQTCRIEYEAGIGDTFYKASIYGSRRERLTEENASLYGVVHDGLIALHEDDYVVFPGEDIEPARTGQLAVIHNGETTWFPDLATLESHFRQPAQP